jgi:hypothetical protein
MPEGYATTSFEFFVRLVPHLALLEHSPQALATSKVDITVYSWRMWARCAKQSSVVVQVDKVPLPPTSTTPRLHGTRRF